MRIKFFSFPSKTSIFFKGGVLWRKKSPDNRVSLLNMSDWKAHFPAISSFTKIFHIQKVIYQASLMHVTYVQITL